MKLVDRYVLSELIRGVVGGLVLFVGVVICIYELQQLIRLLVRQGYPPAAALQAFTYHLPQVVGWVLPVAVSFGVVMAIGRLSSDGELIAMHAGGVSFRRVLAPVALIGLMAVGVLYLMNEVLAPPGLARVRELSWEYGPTALSGKSYSFSEEDEELGITRWVIAGNFEAETNTLENVLIAQFSKDGGWETIRADSATWVGRRLSLSGVERAEAQPNGEIRVYRVETATYYVRDAPEEIARTKRRPPEMTIGQMRQRIKELHAREVNVNQEIRPLELEMAVRRATPWCALGFALVSAPLGIRRIRTSTGVSVGIAVLVFLPYYFVSYTLQVLGKHGGISPEIPAWTGNILLFVVAAGLILDSSR